MKRTYILLTVLLAALLLVGCNRDLPEQTQPTTTPPVTTQPSAPSTEPSTAGTEPSTETTAPAGTQTGGDEAPITDATKPSDAPTQPTTQPTNPPATQPTTAPTQPATQPTTAPTEPATQPPAAELSDYETFRQLSPADQQKYMESFASVEAFFEWYNKAKAEYEAANPPIEIGGDSSVDLGDVLGGK